MNGISFAEVQKAREERNALRREVRETLRVKRAEVRALKAEITASKAEDREERRMALLANGATLVGTYVLAKSAKRFTLVPADPTVPETKGEIALLAAILPTLS